MNTRSVMAVVLGGLLLVLSSIGRRSDTPSPQPLGGGYESAVETSQSYRSGIAAVCMTHADAIDLGEYATEVDDAKAFAAEARKVAIESSDKTSKAFAEMYKATRPLPDDERRKAQAEFYRDYGRGWE